jgi:redox-sensing transcriptional repressor
MLAKKNIVVIPEPTLRRLPHYLHLLLNLKEQGVKNVSSTYIANELGLDSTQVRKDVQYTNIIGKPKTGFDVNTLINAIQTCLNWNRYENAFLIGAGSLGTAMLGYKQFKDYGLNFVAAFDNDPEKIGQKIHGIEVLSIDRLPVLAQLMKIHLAVLTVPAKAAQECVDIMIKGGIVAIWNFAPTQIKVPKNVIVENAQFSQSLAVLTRKLSVYKQTLL